MNQIGHLPGGEKKDGVPNALVANTSLANSVEAELALPQQGQLQMLRQLQDALPTASDGVRRTVADKLATALDPERNEADATRRIKMGNKSPKSAEVKELLADPVGVYKKLKERMDTHGHLAPMPEFEPVVRYLQKELKNPDVVEYCRNNPFAEAARQLVLNGLWHTDLSFQVSPNTGGYHQHTPPATGRFPYRPTLQAIDECISFFDSYERATQAGHDRHYQLDRYRYHGLTLPELSDWVVMPSADPISLKDLIILRAAPVGLRMACAKTSFLDAYFNSPLNAAVHDDNHSRRMRSENEGFFQRNGITTPEQKMAAFQEFQRVIKDIIIPDITVTKEMPEHEKNVRKAMLILYFEYLHEYAKTPDRETLKTELMFKPDGPSAFEVVLKPGETPEQLEQRRLDNKNLDSGAIFTGGQGDNKVYYFMDKGRNFLTSAYNKVQHGFFDNGQDNLSQVPPLIAQTPALFCEAAMRIMKAFDISVEETGLTRKKIVALLLNKDEGDVLGQNLETYPGHDASNPLNKAPRKVTGTEQPDSMTQGFLLG